MVSRAYALLLNNVHTHPMLSYHQLLVHLRRGHKCLRSILRHTGMSCWLECACAAFRLHVPVLSLVTLVSWSFAHCRRGLLVDMASCKNIVLFELSCSFNFLVLLKISCGYMCLLFSKQMSTLNLEPGGICANEGLWLARAHQQW